MTPGLSAQAERFEARAARAAAVLHGERESPILPQPVAAELDYMLTAKKGRGANLNLLRDLAAGRFRVPCIDSSDFAVIEALNQQYLDLDVGLTDLSVVIMAARFNTTRILTFDEKHFRALRPLQGGAFKLLPADL